MKMYIIPNYLVENYLPDHIKPMTWSLPPEINYKYCDQTITEVAKDHGLKNFDVALPIDWVKDFQQETGFNPVGHFVFNYDNTSFGIPFPVTIEGQIAYKIYKHIKEKINA